jgi:hypothetical protein
LKIVEVQTSEMDEITASISLAQQRVKMVNIAGIHIMLCGETMGVIVGTHC